METSVTQIDDGKVELTFTIPVEDVDKAFNRTYQKISSGREIPGFRKGKVPREIIKQSIGEETIAFETLNDILFDAYVGAVEEENIVAIGQPEFDPWPTLEEKKPLEVTAKVLVMPEYEIADYAKFEVDFNRKLEVTDKDVDDAIEEMKAEMAEQVPLTEERPAGGNDLVNVNYKIGDANSEDDIFDEKDDVDFQLGKDAILPDIEKNIIGMSVGDEKTFDIIYPEDYPNAELANKKTSVSVKINSIMQSVPPETDEEILEKLGENGPEDMKTLRDQLTKGLESKKTQEQNQEITRILVESVVNNTNLVVPEQLIEEEMEERFEYLASIMQEREGKTMEEYALANGSTVEEMREKEKPDVTMTIKRRIIFNRIFADEKMKILPHDMETTLQTYAMENYMNTAKIKKMLRDRSFVNSMRQRIRDTKVMALLRGRLVYKDDPVKEKEVKNDKPDAAPEAKSEAKNEETKEKSTEKTTEE